MPELPGKPTRPSKVEYLSIRELYLQFDEMFLADKQSLIVSPCGHKIYCFDHHFFHMAGVFVEGVDELSMQDEKEIILNTHTGFAHYELREGGSRARHLRSARDTLESPDEIWAENPRVESAKWVYIKEYDSKPYSFSLAFVGEWKANSTILVPFSSFQFKKGNAKKWRQSKKIYP
ncbi:MAG: PBECR2 nuclease fold domain-containing protein [Candidatus Acidiferrales bacterium]